MITAFSQKDKRWSGLKIAGNLTIGKYGCFITCLSMLDGRTPDVVLKILKADGALTSQGLLISKKAADSLGFIYKGVTSWRPRIPCIAETHDFKKFGFAQHFFVWLGNGLIIDSLDGKTKTLPYKVASYRLFFKGDVA